MALENALFVADVAHARQRPRRNAFRYKVWYICFDLGDKDALEAVPFFSVNRFNLFSFFDRDHGAKDITDAKTWAREVLTRFGVVEADGKIVLLTMPRLLGHVFNPVSFWFCFGKDESLRAVIAEVNNTFGDRHSYLVRHEDHRPILPSDEFHAEKVFHVSPFMDMSGSYRFRFNYGEDKIGIWIDHADDDGVLLSTSVTGKRSALNARSLIYCFFRYPLVTLKVIGLIHFQALVLVLKKIRYYPRPAPPPEDVSG